MSTVETTTKQWKAIHAREAAEALEMELGNWLAAHDAAGVFTAIGNMFRIEGLPQFVKDDYCTSNLLEASKAALRELISRHAIDHLQRVTPLTPEAEHELQKLMGTAPVAVDAKTKARRERAEAMDKLLNDYRNLDGVAFKRRYMDTDSGRQLFEQAISEGRV